MQGIRYSIADFGIHAILLYFYVYFSKSHFSYNLFLQTNRLCVVFCAGARRRRTSGVARVSV